MPAAKACAALPPDCVDLINEDDSRGVFLGLFKQIAHTGSADADVHLDKVGTRNREKRHARFACDCAGEQCFTGTGGADEQHALWNARPDLVEFAGILEELDDLGELRLFLFSARHLVKGGLAPFFHAVFEIGLAELAHFACAARTLFHHKDKQHNYKPNREQRGDHLEKPGVVRGWLVIELDNLRVGIRLHLLKHHIVHRSDKQVDARHLVGDLFVFIRFEDHLEFAATEVELGLLDFILLEIADDLVILEVAWGGSHIRKHPDSDKRHHHDDDHRHQITFAAFVSQSFISFQVV